MNSSAFRCLALSLPLSLGVAWAQADAVPAPGAALHNVLHLSATGEVEVVQDWLRLTMTTTREGADAASVQTQLRQAVDAALAQAKTTAQPGQMEVRSGNFQVYPRYGREGKINGWQGSAELILEGQDFARITAAAARASSLNISSLSFGLSRQRRAEAQQQAQAQAIERFKAQATETARAFGFGSYSLREVRVGLDSPDMPQPVRSMARQVQAMAAEAAVPAEPGTSTVQVTVSGSVQAR